MTLVLPQGAKLAGLGLALGVALSLFSVRMLEGLLFGVTPKDSLTLIAAAGGIALATLLATYIPGPRAVRVDPMTALRAQ
jgi:ABC-type lipoprotein release transport system permease subunit